MYSPEALKELELLRQKALTPEYSIDDLRRYIMISRTDREAAQSAAQSTKKRTTKKEVNVDALLDSLGKV